MCSAEAEDKESNQIISITIHMSGSGAKTDRSACNSDRCRSAADQNDLKAATAKRHIDPWRAKELKAEKK